MIAEHDTDPSSREFGQGLLQLLLLLAQMNQFKNTAAMVRSGSRACCIWSAHLLGIFACESSGSADAGGGADGDCSILLYDCHNLTV